jgi:hypothetical protein
MYKNNKFIFKLFFFYINTNINLKNYQFSSIYKNIKTYTNWTKLISNKKNFIYKKNYNNYRIFKNKKKIIKKFFFQKPDIFFIDPNITYTFWKKNKKKGNITHIIDYQHKYINNKNVYKKFTYYEFNINFKENKNFKKIIKKPAFYFWLIFIFNESWPWFQNTSFSNYLEQTKYLWKVLAKHEKRMQKLYQRAFKWFVKNILKMDNTNINDFYDLYYARLRDMEEKKYWKEVMKELMTPKFAFVISKKFTFYKRKKKIYEKIHTLK